MNKPLLAAGVAFFAVFLFWSVSAAAQVCEVPDAIQVTDDYVIPAGEMWTVTQSIEVCQGGSLSGTTGGIVFDGDDLMLHVAGTINIAAPEVTSWLDTVPKGTFEPFQYGITRSPTISSGSATLSSEPIGWQVGDTLLITTEQGEVEKATLESINGRQITFDSNLIAYALRYEGHTIVAKVGNLSRRFTISTTGSAHTMYVAGADVDIVNTEFRDLGIRGQMGQYPVHFHMMSQTDARVTGSSIHSETPSNRAITIHSTQGATVADNIAYNVQGHAIFMESGDEYDNVVTGNLTAMVRWHEELPNVDSEIFRGVSFATNHYWVRQGNVLDGNVAIGGELDDFPTNRLGGYLNGVVVLPSDRAVDTTVNDFECLGCGGFGAWGYTEEAVIFDGLNSVYNKKNGWYPVLANDQLHDSVLLMNGWGGDMYAGQVFSNSASSVVVDSHLAGYFGIHNHYVGTLELSGGSINARYVIDPAYWETITRLENIELTGESLFYRKYPNLKRNSPVPIWLDSGVTFNGEPMSGMYVRHDEHSQFFETIGSPIYSGIEVVPEPAYYLPEPGTRWFRSVTPVGNTETQTSYMSEYEGGLNESMAAGNLGYPHGFPAGEYVVRYYTSEYGDFISEETVTLGNPPPPNRPPVATIVTSQNYFADTDQQPGETILFEATASDPDGDQLAVEWLLDEQLVSSELTSEIFASDGIHTIELRVRDTENSEVSQFHDFEVGAYVPPVTDWEQMYRELINDMQNLIDTH